MISRAVCWSKRRFLRGQFARQLAVLAGGTAFGQALLFLVAPVLTRLYTPADYGVLAVYSSILGVVSVVACLRFELVIPLPAEETDAANLVGVSLGIAGLVSLVTGAGVWLVTALDLFPDHVDQLGVWIWLLPLSVFWTGWYQTLSAWGIRRSAFGRVAKTRVTQSVSQIAVQLGLGFLGNGPGGLILGQIAGQTGGSGTLANLAFREDRTAFSGISWAAMSGGVKRYGKQSAYATVAALLNSMGLQLPILLLTSAYTTTVVGLFGLGQRLFALPLDLVGRSVAQVYLSRAAELARGNVRELATLFRVIATRLFMVATVILVPVALIAPWLFSVAFGATWYEAGVFVRIMAANFVGQFVMVPLSHTLVVLERQDLLLLWNTVRVILVAGSLMTAKALGLSASGAIAMLSGSGLFAYVLLFILTQAALRQRMAQVSG